MPHSFQEKTVFTLQEVAQSIQRTLAERYAQSFWVMAEMNKLNHYPYSGHCYPELLEKRDGKVVAQMRGILWKSDYQRINQKFVAVVREPLKDGTRLLMCAQVAFDPAHGLSLRIIDIDPGFSLGALELEKRAALERLKSEDILDQNKRVPMPALPLRLAIISADTSKGYADFMQVIERNGEGIRFFHMLFPALLQGERSVDSIRAQLQRIRRVRHHFDVVAIIRGGGGDVGLSSYNDYTLARDIATFPLPILTGIGHSTNETVSEMVSHQNAITPTAIAEFLLRRCQQVVAPVLHAERQLAGWVRRVMRQHRDALWQQVRAFRAVSREQLQAAHHGLARDQHRLQQGQRYRLREAHTAVEVVQDNLEKSVRVRLRQVHQQLERMAAQVPLLFRQQFVAKRQHLLLQEKSLTLVDPAQVLKRGYSITLYQGKAIASTAHLTPGAEVVTWLADGTITSHIIQTDRTSSDGKS